MPPVGRPRRKARGDASDVTSELVSDEMTSLTTVVGQRVRHSESESSASEAGVAAEKPKKYKSEKVAAAAAAAAAVSADTGNVSTAAMDTDPDVRAAAAGVPNAAVPRESRPRRKSEPKGSVSVAELRKVTDSLYDAAFGLGLSLSAVKCIVDHGGRYEDLVMRLMLENEGLRGKLEGLQSVVRSSAGVTAAATTDAVSGAAVAAGVSYAGAVAAPVTRAVGVSQLNPEQKAVETWSVVVKGKGAKSSKEVVDKVIGHVAPALGVRVHGVLPTRDGGAVIRTRSVGERRKILENKKFEEVGLEVSVKDKLGPKIVVKGVQTVISTDEFMEELYSLNLEEMMPREKFKRCVRLVSAPWKEGEGTTNVTLECTMAVAEHLRVTGVYIKWFRFLVRVMDIVPACHKCCSFDHRIRECKAKEDICRMCGQGGHIASRCTNPVHCRNCAIRRKPAGHPMMSMECPVYAAMVARANARH